MATRRRRWSGPTKAQRDAILFAMGIAGVAHTVVFHYDNPSLPLLGVYVGFVGAVPFLWIRDALRDKEAPK